MLSLMKFMLCSALLSIVRNANAAEVTPVEKVLELMDSMLAKGKKAKKDEATEYNAYKQFCDETTVEKTRAIDEAKEAIGSLTADIEGYTADADKLEKEIAEHDEDITTWQRDIKAATFVREIEKADYTKAHAGYTESIDAIKRAVAVIKKKANDASFVQVGEWKNLDLIPKEARDAIDLMLSQQADLSVNGQPAYEHKSQGIIDMLEKLLTKFEDELTELEKQEGEAKHAFEMLISDMNQQIDDATTSREEKSSTKAAKLQAKADAESNLQDTTATRDDDAKYLADLTASCEQKASDFAERQATRQQEIEAIEKAVEIIAGIGGFVQEKHLPSLSQMKSTSLTQLRVKVMNKNQARVADYLKKQANRVNSRILAALYQRVLADPFKKVKKMIKDMVTKLQEEAAAEAEEKGFCDKELSTNEQTRNEKTEVTEQLYAEIDELKATIAQLTEDITDLTKAITDLDAAVAEATGVRQSEKAKNAQTIEDASAGEEAVTQALTVLKEFYEKEGVKTDMGGESNGVIGMLEVIQSDFARLEAETKAAEEVAAKEYDEFMSDSETDKTQKNRDIEHKVKTKQDKSQSLEEREKDLEGTQKELDAALKYYEKLKPDCIDTGISYEERVARREEEIESLREALSILSGESV